MPAVVNARLIAPHARRWLASRPQARALHIFDRVCNLVSDAGEVVSLISPPLLPDPLAVVLADPLDFTQHVTVADPVQVTASHIQIGALRVHVQPAALWPPRPDWEQAARQIDRVRAGLPQLADLLSRHAPPDSFAVLVVQIQGSRPAAYPATQAQAIAAARAPARRLADAIRQQDAAASVQAAHTLAGLGGGLTPAGDDFIVGALYGLWLCAPHTAHPLAGRIAQAAAPRTTRLSAAWLAAAARGETSARWQTLIAALAEGDDAGSAHHARAIMQIGHTSGADALAGFLATVIAPSPPPP